MKFSTRICLFLLTLIGLSQCKPKTSNSVENKTTLPTLPIAWQLNKDGSFGVKSATLQIQNFYPQIEGQAIRPLSFKIDSNASGGQIVYQLESNKQIIISLDADSNSLTLAASLKGYVQLPEYFCPAGAGCIQGADRIFKQGLGFGGPSAIMPIPRSGNRVDVNGLHEHVWSYDSYLASGILAADNQTMAIGAYDHHQYVQRTTFYNKQTRFGLVDRWEAMNKEFIDIAFSTENMNTNGGEVKMPTVHLTTGKVPFDVFQNFAKNIAQDNNLTLKQTPAYHWCSWYETQKEFNETVLNDVLNGLDKITPKIPIQTVQIDDGYFTYYGDWLNFDTVKFPSGFENNVTKIKAAGYRPGVWIGPFMVHEKSDVFKQHPDWILHHPDGKLVLEWENAQEGNVYILDSSNPEAFAYLRSVFKKLKAMGFAYYKTDFMDWGLRNSVKYKRHTPGKTSAQYFNEVLQMIREEIGAESFWLGCIMPFPPAIGYVDAIRNSNDVGTTWSADSHGNMIQESMVTQYSNNILWQTDPDVLYMNSFKTMLTPAECNTLALFDGMLGGVTNTSDRFHNMSKENLMLWRFIEPSKKHSSAIVPFWDKESALKVLVRNYEKGAGAVLFTNDKDVAITATYSVQQLVGKAEKYFFQWQPSISKSVGIKSELTVTLQAHQSILYYMADEEVAPNPALGLYGEIVKGL